MLDDAALAVLRARQDGVVARWQVRELGGTPADFRRVLRAGAPMERGVCVDHTGEPTWSQRAWGAVLAVWPAALAGQSALRAEAGLGWPTYVERSAILVAVDRQRQVDAPAGARVVRVSGLDAKVRWNAAPPRIRFEIAALDVALDTSEMLARIEVLTAGVRARCTTAERLLDALDARSRARGRADLRAVLVDLRDGTCSALEHGYLSLVERPHRLPRPERQFHERSDGRAVYRDAEYRRFRVTVELDGRTFHARDDQHARDLERDLDLVVANRRAVRLGWRQVFDTPCVTAEKIGAVLATGGWTGGPEPCGAGCALSVAA